MLFFYLNNLSFCSFWIVLYFSEVSCGSSFPYSVGTWIYDRTCYCLLHPLISVLANSYYVACYHSSAQFLVSWLPTHLFQSCLCQWLSWQSHSCGVPLFHTKIQKQGHFIYLFIYKNKTGPLRSNKTLVKFEAITNFLQKIPALLPNYAELQVHFEQYLQQPHCTTLSTLFVNFPILDKNWVI